MKSENDRSDLLLRLKLGIIGGLVGPLLIAAIPGALLLVEMVSAAVSTHLMPQEDGFISGIGLMALWLLGVVLGCTIIALIVWLAIQKADAVVFFASAVGFFGAAGGMIFGMIIISLLKSLGGPFDEDLIELLSVLLAGFLGGFLLNLWLTNAARLSALLGTISKKASTATSDNMLDNQDSATK